MAPKPEHSGFQRVCVGVVSCHGRGGVTDGSRCTSPLRLLCGHFCASVHEPEGQGLELSCESAPNHRLMPQAAVTSSSQVGHPGLPGS